MSIRYPLPALLLLFIFWLTAAAGQNATDPPKTRAEEIEQASRAKAANPPPDTPDKVENYFKTFENLSDRIFGNESGFRPKIGGMVPGSGFAIGPEYYRPDLLNGNVNFRISAAASLRKYQRYDIETKFPHLAGDHAFIDLSGSYKNYPTINYYGPGPDSRKDGRSNFRIETTLFDMTAGVKPLRRLVLGVTGGYRMYNVGSGTDERFISSEKLYPPSVATGIDRQSNFLVGGPFLEIDYRDRPGNPHTGTYMYASYLYHQDRKLDISNFRKLTAEGQQYFSFFNQKRVIALRARTELSYRNTNQVVPFYLQPTLGGADTLRGFRPFRFYDNNMMLINAEYRWEVFKGFDMAVFGDAGKVFHRHAQLNLADTLTTAGFGLRFKSRQAVFMRWDVGFSREGFQIWIVFKNIF